MTRGLQTRLQLPVMALLMVLGLGALQAPVCAISVSPAVLDLRLGYNLVVGDVEAAAHIMKLKQQNPAQLGG
jgi:hypothetical protein